MGKVETIKTFVGNRISDLRYYVPFPRSIDRRLAEWQFRLYGPPFTD